MGGRRWILGLVGAVLFAAVAAVVVVTVPGTWLVARGVLAGVLLLAGAAKLRDRAAFVVVLEGLGVPTVLRRAIARGLPVVEIAVAVALLVPVSSTAGGIAALAVLLVLSGVVLVALARARSLDCGCFGEDHSTPLSGTTLLRNGALVGLAAGIALASPAAQTAALGASASARSLVALGSATLMVAALLLATRRLPRTVANQPNTSLEVVAAGGTPTSPVTRRGLIRTAAGAGAAGALGASLGWLDPSTARAALTTSTTADKLSCGECQCCRFDTIIGEICRERCCVICPGFAGGGVIQTATGTAQASFFGDTVQLKGSRQLVTGGALSWFDAGWQGTGLSLRSTRITRYRRIPGTNIRELTGFASANGQGKHTFVLRAVDVGRPGSGQDTVSLTVSGVPGAGAGGTGSQYVANGRLVQGDITIKLQARVSAR